MSPIHLFTLADIPVRISLGYLLLALYFAYGAMARGTAFALVAVFVLTLSLLVHEFGHALVARRFRLSPQIMLHGWGGLCFHERAQRNRDDALIIAAGPAAGLVFGAISYGVATVLASKGVFEDRMLLHFMFEQLIFINIYWSILNLLPLWPLDGGQLFRLGMIRLARPARGERITHLVGAAIGVFGTVYALTIWKSPFIAIVAGMLAFENIRRIGSWAASGPIRTRNTAADELLSQAAEAMRVRDFSEAARLAHQVRDMGNLSTPQIDAVWSVLTISACELGEHQDAIDYSTRSPRIAPVFVARLKSLVALDRKPEARRELAASDIPRLTPAQLQALRALVD